MPWRLKISIGMVSEARFEGVESALVAVIGAQFEDARGVGLGQCGRG